MRCSLRFNSSSHRHVTVTGCLVISSGRKSRIWGPGGSSRTTRVKLPTMGDRPRLPIFIWVYRRNDQQRMSLQHTAKRPSDTKKGEHVLADEERKT